MKHSRNSKLKIKRILLLVFICMLLGPQFFVFMPEIIFLVDLAGLEFIVFFIAMSLKPIKDHVVFWTHIIIKNKYFRKYGMLILLLFFAPLAPELFLLINLVGVELAFACILMNIRQISDCITQRIRTS